MSQEYHPVLKNTFETEGENKGKMKNTELVHELASAANDVYDKKVAEGRYNTDEFHAEMDAQLRRGFAHAAVASEYPESSDFNHYVAADMAAKGNSGSNETKLGELTAKAKEVVDQYDDLRKKAA